MLSRMIARLLLKVGLSLGILLGIASYAHYLMGGDPGALWRRVAGGAIDGAADSFGELRGRVRAPVAALAGGGADTPRRDSLWTWRDANGVTHYASERPAGVDAARITVDPDVNVLAPTRAPEPPGARSAGGAPSRGDPGSPAGVGAPLGAAAAAAGGGAVRGTSRRDSADDEALPGIAGAVLRARGDAPAPDPAQAEALLRLLQPGAR